jgi:hypothetical protein
MPKSYPEDNWGDPVSWEFSSDLEVVKKLVTEKWACEEVGWCEMAASLEPS